MKDSKQMELIPSTSLQEDTLANLSPSQVEKKVKKIRDTSGQSILDLSKNSDRLGLLEKMLVDTLNSVSTPLSRTWRVKVTPLGRLVFQLRASVPTTKEKESGYWRTPDAHSGRGPSSEERMKMKLDKKMPISLNDQVAHPNLMWPTPRASAAMAEKTENIQKRGTQRGKLEESVAMWPTPTTDSASNRTKKYKQGGTPLTVAVREAEMWPTPTTRDYKDSGKAVINSHRDSILPVRVAKKDKEQWVKGGGSLNPTWVEWLMGYPSGWTDLNHSETVSSHKSPTTSDQSSSKRWRTPTAIDGGDKAEKYAARILLGKNKRSSKHKVQETLSMQVAMEELKDDPQRVEELMKEEMTTRPQLPEQKEFVEYMHSQTTPRKLSDQSGIDYTTVEHWFRRGGSFSYPSVKDWNHIKQFLQEVKFDKEMTTMETIEWKN